MSARAARRNVHTRKRERARAYAYVHAESLRIPKGRDVGAWEKWNAQEVYKSQIVDAQGNRVLSRRLAIRLLGSAVLRRLLRHHLLGRCCVLLLECAAGRVVTQGETERQNSRGKAGGKCQHEHDVGARESMCARACASARARCLRSPQSRRWGAGKMERARGAQKRGCLKEPGTEQAARHTPAGERRIEEAVAPSFAGEAAGTWAAGTLVAAASVAAGTSSAGAEGQGQPQQSCRPV